MNAPKIIRRKTLPEIIRSFGCESYYYGSNILKLILVLAIGALGIWFALQVMFIDSIEDMVNEMNTATASGSAIAWDLLKITLSGSIVYISIKIVFYLLPALWISSRG